jgi:hypothetical protein
MERQATVKQGQGGSQNYFLVHNRYHRVTVFKAATYSNPAPFFVRSAEMPLTNSARRFPACKPGHQHVAAPQNLWHFALAAHFNLKKLALAFGLANTFA